MNGGTGTEQTIGLPPFRFVTTIQPRRGTGGVVATYTHKAPAGKRLNPYGRGPFCRFAVPTTWPYAGVYALTVDDEVVYVGECENLSRRFGPQGYGTIASPETASAMAKQQTARSTPASPAPPPVTAGSRCGSARRTAALKSERQLIAALKPPLELTRRTALIRRVSLGGRIDRHANGRGFPTSARRGVRGRGPHGGTRT